MAMAEADESYLNLTACEKQSELWKRALASKYQELPDFNNLGLMQFLAMTFQELKQKTDYDSDFAPKGWKKYLHRKGVLAQVEIISKSDHPYTGVFKGAPCALVRLSLTYNPKGDKPVAPGLALKVLRDKTPSANISALYTLDGQGKDFNFFKYPLSNIVPVGDNLGQKLIHRLFKRVSDYPEELMLRDLATVNVAGKTESKAINPVQIFFVPNPDLKFSSTEHDVRTDLLSIKKGSLLFNVYALKNAPKGFDYANYKESDIATFIKRSQLIAEIKTTSEFVASQFGDAGIFFRHEVRESVKGDDY